MNTLTIECDVCRGGFIVEFCDQPQTSIAIIFGGFMNGGMIANTRFARLYCYDRKNGRFPLLHAKDDAFHHLIPLSPTGGAFEHLLIVQSAKQLEIWFAGSLADQPPTLHDEKYSISIWMADNLVMGIRLDMRAVAAHFPFDTLRLCTGDVK